MAKLDPYVAQWPVKWMQDNEIRPSIEYLNRFLHDIFIRTGGDDDAIESVENEEAFDPGIQTFEQDDFEAEIDDSDLSPHLVIIDPEVVGITANYTTTGSQIVICSNSSAITVTLNATPDDGESVHIKRQNALVTVSGAVDGDSSKDIIFKYDSPHLVYTIAAGEWSIV